MSEKNIYLTTEEQEYLKSIVRKGVHTSQVITRARVLLMLDRTGKLEHVRYNRTAEAVGISKQAVYNMRDEYLSCRDVEIYLTRKKRETPPVPAKVDGKIEAQIIALACSKPPEGCAKWTLRLLSEKCVELKIIDEISHVTIQRLLKKRNISLT